jgi:D-glycerate 3-kinase
VNDAPLRRLADWLAPGPRGRARVIGINGAQGSGKSTLAARLREALERRHGLRAAILSIDDLYLSRAARERLAAEVHPLLRTRGVPGTHEVELGVELLDRLGSRMVPLPLREGTGEGLRTLKTERPLPPAHPSPQPPPARGGGEVRVPKFIKALDDRAPESGWTAIDTPVDLVLFEGWCVGTPPQDQAALAEPVNALERDEDADGRWRQYVNAQLATRYAPLFARIERLIFLRAPDFDSIFRWRQQQEAQNAQAAGAAGMDAAALRRFIQHYERLTRHALDILPGRADAVIELGAEHEWREVRRRDDSRALPS